jgi:hypothetical protein
VAVLGHHIRGEDGCRERRGVKALFHGEANSILGRYLDVAGVSRMVSSVVGYSKGWDFVGRQGTKVPKDCLTISGADHGAAVNMGLDFGVRVKSRMFVTEVLVELTAGGLGLTDESIKGVEGFTELCILVIQ